MNQQLSFAYDDDDYNNIGHQIRKETFLSRMDKLIPWNRLEAVITPHFTNSSSYLCSYSVSTMLRIHCMQHWYSLSAKAMEDALYESASMRLFAGLSLDKTIPDHTVIMNFRYLLEQKGLA